MNINGECSAQLLAQAVREYARVNRSIQSQESRLRYWRGEKPPVGPAYDPLPPIAAAIDVPALAEATRAWERVAAALLDIIAQETAKHPLWTWAQNIKGHTPGLVGQVLGFLVGLPPLPTKGPSTWWKVAGLAPQDVDGRPRLPRPRRGEKHEGHLGYIPQLRRNLYVLFESLAKARGYYFWAYWAFRAELQPHYQELGRRAIDAHAVARVKTIKLWLSHAYRKWGEAVGIEVPLPYSSAYLGRREYDPPERDRRVDIDIIRGWVESEFEPFYEEQVPDLAQAREAMLVSKRQQEGQQEG